MEANCQDLCRDELCLHIEVIKLKDERKTSYLLYIATILNFIHGCHKQSVSHGYYLVRGQFARSGTGFLENQDQGLRGSGIGDRGSDIKKINNTKQKRKINQNTNSCKHHIAGLAGFQMERREETRSAKCDWRGIALYEH